MALELHSLGANIIVLDLNPPHPSLQKSVPTDSRFAYAQCDVASYASQLAAFKYCEQKYGRFPDVVYANAGIGEQFKPLIPVELHNVDEDQEMELEPKHEVIEIDLKAVANTVRLAWLGMRKELKAGRLEKGGSIILTASMAGHCGQPGLVLYNAAKHVSAAAIMSAFQRARPMRNRSKMRITHLLPFSCWAILISDILLTDAGPTGRRRSRALPALPRAVAQDCHLACRADNYQYPNSDDDGLDTSATSADDNALSSRCRRRVSDAQRACSIGSGRVRTRRRTRQYSLGRVARHD